jgi:hypothetical protein
LPDEKVNGRIRARIDFADIRFEEVQLDAAYLEAVKLINWQCQFGLQIDQMQK